MTSPSDKALLQGLHTAWDDFTELVDWWRARKTFFERAQDPAWETKLHSYHIMKPFINMIKRQADLECTSQKEIINRALQQFFAGSETVDDEHG